MKLCAFAGLFPLIFVSMASGVTITFDDLPGATNIADGAVVPAASELSNTYYAGSYGLVIHSITRTFADPHVGVGVANFGSSAPSPPNVIVGLTTIGAFNYSSPIDFDFWSPADVTVPATTDFFSVRDPIGGGSQITMYAYDVNNTLLGSDTETDTGSATWTVSFPNIHTVVFGNVLSPPAGGIAVDNVSFSPVAVPEPGSMVLLAGPAFGLLRSRRVRIK